VAQRYMILYDKEFNVDSKAECDQLNLAHVATNRKVFLKGNY